MGWEGEGCGVLKKRISGRYIFSFKVTNSSVLEDVPHPPLPGAFPLTRGEIFQELLHTHAHTHAHLLL